MASDFGYQVDDIDVRKGFRDADPVNVAVRFDRPFRRFHVAGMDFCRGCIS
jgi:hypothetical protein